MGNTFGIRRKRSAKVLKINGETFKIKLNPRPVLAGSLLQDHPGHLLLDSQAVKLLGMRAKPLEADHELVPNRVYFLVEFPNFPNPRRVRSGIHMSAKDRLESLMLGRRCVSDVGVRRVKMRVRKQELERVMAESRDGAEVAHNILRLCTPDLIKFKLHNHHNNNISIHIDDDDPLHLQKGVEFLPITQPEIQVALAS